MPEKDNVFSSKIKNSGIFSFADFYKFCHDWIAEELKFEVSEDKYAEKLSGDSKNMEIEWTCWRKVTDYFKFEIKASFRIIGLTNVEITKNGMKIKTNKGNVELSIKGNLIRDYQGKFEKTAFQKFLRGIYEKWIIYSRVNDYEDKLIGNCEELLNQAKAYLDLEGKK